MHVTEFKTRDEQEVAGYAYVMDQVFDAFEQIPVTENMIGQLHHDLLRYSTNDECYRGVTHRRPSPTRKKDRRPPP